MAFVTNTGVLFQFAINGVDLPLDANNVESLLIVNNIYDNLPTLRITIKDDKNIFNSIQLFDGIKFSILIGNRQEGSTKVRKEDNLAYHLMFSLLSIPDYALKTTTTKITLYGILNYLELWKDRKPLSIVGTSNEAIAYIMRLNEIDYEGITTYDSMTWHNFGKSQIDFVKDITSRSFVKDGSCMLSFFNYNGTFKLIDVNRFRKPDFILNNLGIANEKDNKNKEITYYYSDLNYRHQSGITDYTYSYRNVGYQYAFSKNNTSELLSDKKNELVKLDDLYSNEFNINEIDYDLINRVNFNIDGINIGNVHPNWNKAKFQNMRYKSFFNIYSEVYIPSITPIDVGHMVEVKFNSTNKDMKDVFGYKYWFVEAKTLALSVNQYTEKLLLSTTGFSNNIWENKSRKGFTRTADGGIYA